MSWLEDLDDAPFAMDAEYIPLTDNFKQQFFSADSFGTTGCVQEGELTTSDCLGPACSQSSSSLGARGFTSPSTQDNLLDLSSKTFLNYSPTQDNSVRRIVNISHSLSDEDLPFEPEPELPSFNTVLPPISTKRISHRITVRLKLSKSCGIWNESQLLDWPYPSAYVRQQMPHRLSRGGREEIDKTEENLFLDDYKEEAVVDLAAANDIGSWEWANGSMDDSMATAVPDMRSVLNKERLRRGLLGDGAWKKVTKIEEVSDEDETETETENETSSQSGTDRKSRLRTPSEAGSWAPSSSDESWDVVNTVERPISLPAATVSLPQVEVRQQHAYANSLNGLDDEYWKATSTTSLFTGYPGYAWTNPFPQETVFGRLEGLEHNAAGSNWLPFMEAAEVQEHMTLSRLSSLHEHLNEQLEHINQLRNVALMALDNRTAHPAIQHLADIEAMDYHMRLETEAQSLEERLEDIELELSRSGEVGDVGVEDMVLHRLAISRDEVELHIDGVEAKWRSWPLSADNSFALTTTPLQNQSDVDHQLNFHGNAILSIFQTARAELQRYSWAWHQLSLPHLTYPLDGFPSVTWPILPPQLSGLFPLPTSLSTIQTAQYQTHIFLCLSFGFLPVLPKIKHENNNLGWQFYQGEGAHLIASLEGLGQQIVADIKRWDRHRLKEVFGVQVSCSSRVKGVRLALTGLKGLLRDERKRLGLMTDGEDENRVRL